MQSGETSDGAAIPPRVLVLADDREPECVIDALRGWPEVEVRVQRLRLGDYVVDDRCVFERKTVTDFAQSVVDGRLFRQCRQLARGCPLAAVIIEGKAGDLNGCAVRREALQGAMVSLSLIYRLPVLRSLDAQETARLLVYAGRQMRRHQSDAGLSPGPRPKGKRRRQLRLLQGLPGVGAARAARLLETFGSVEAVITAGPDALAEVEGIGPKTAAAIRDVLRESPPPYGRLGPGSNSLDSTVEMERDGDGSCFRAWPP